MKKIIMVVLLSTSNLAMASVEAFATLDKSYSIRTGSMEVSDMPQIRSQDGLGICYGFSSWTLLQQHRCVKSNINPCRNLDPKTTTSPLYLATLGASPRHPDKESGPYFIPTKGGGLGLLALQGIEDESYSYAESCYPFDQFISKHRNSAKDTQDAFKRLEELYDKNKSKTEGDACIDCLSKSLESEFDIKLSATKVAQSLGAGSFDKFLFEAFLVDCEDVVENKPQITVAGWPKDGKEYSYDKALTKIKEKLKENKPVQSRLCVDKKVAIKDCRSIHEVVISGYRKSCKPDGTCRESLKITNSWGQDWQNANDDGWVDAKTYYDYMGKEAYGISWVVDKESRK